MSEPLPWWSWSIDGWIVVVAIVCASACAIPGTFLVLRRLSLMGDAISHAVLPGIAAAFLITGSRSSLPMFLGAVVVGVLTAVLTEWLRSRGRIEENSSIGVVFTTLFALGLVLIVRGANRVDLDPGCVLYGAIELSPLDLVQLGAWRVPRAVLAIGTVLVVNLVGVRLLWKEFALSSFDAEGAASQGIRPGLMHMVLMTMTAVTAVAAFESVGSILVVALLIVPAATARLLTHRLGPMLLTAMGIGALCSVLGHVAALRVPALFDKPSTNTAGMIAVMSGVLLALAAMVRALRSRWLTDPARAVSTPGAGSVRGAGSGRGAGTTRGSRGGRGGTELVADSAEELEMRRGERGAAG